MGSKGTIMKLGRLIIVSLLSGCLLPHALLAQENRKPVKIEGQQVLPLRILARPMSHIYQEPDESKGTVEENVPTFQPYYVYTRPESRATDTDVKGWYEVGSDNRGNVLGWMRADDVIEWKQTMSLAYTHPQGRKPVLMFETRDAVLGLVKASSEERAQKVTELYASIENKQIPEDFPVRSVEPKKAVDITKQFYLLPIIEFGSIEVDGREGRILKLAAATSGGPNAREKTTLKDQQYLEQATEGASDIGAKELQQLQIDLVFVMDMSNSMQPYIDETLKVVKDLSQRITQNDEVQDSFRFGLWGYRDSETIPGIEFNTKTFTPELQDVKAFEDTLSQVKAAQVGSEGYDEDVFSGVDQALTKTAWSEKALRFLVLMGDAPGHGLEHQWNASGQSAETLRQYADDKKVYIATLHIMDQRAADFHPTTQAQFTTLAMNVGIDTPAYMEVDSQDTAGFGKFTEMGATTFIEILAAAKQGRMESTPQQAQAQGESQGQTASPQQSQGEANNLGQQAKEMIKAMGHAALVQWIGKETEAQAPRDIIAWAVDKDLADPTIQSMEVKLLINKKQLDSLSKVLGQVISAGRLGQVGGEDFFSALQATAATTVRDPNRIQHAKSMAEAGLVPEFLVGLPYKSQLMAMNNELWSSWSEDEQDEFLRELQAKIELYGAIHDTPADWVPLNKQDDPDEYVYPLSLDALP